jgi:multisite-specific tRNA:(cytosine-C5)-methyltransferase
VGSHALSTLKALQEIHIPHLQGITWEGQLVDPPKALPWYPDNLGNSSTIGAPGIGI